MSSRGLFYAVAVWLFLMWAIVGIYYILEHTL